MTWYRVANILQDGRKVYFSKRGLLHLMSEAEANEACFIGRSEDVDRNPLVYATNLSVYGNRSLFLDNLAPFVMVERTVKERADEPLDPQGYVLGGVSASSVKVFRKGG